MNSSVVVVVLGLLAMSSCLPTPHSTDSNAGLRSRRWGGFGGFGGMNLGMMAGQMGGNFPGIVQSSSNSWGSYKMQRQGGFNKQEQAFIMG